MMEIDHYLKHICKIEKHPITELDEEYRIAYVRGLGACLSHFSLSSRMTKMYYRVWACSILKREVDIEQYWKEDSKAIKNAIAIHWHNWKLFSVKYAFMFDVYYLLLSSNEKEQKQNILESIFVYLDKEICNVFNKGALKYIYSYFNSSDVNQEFSKIDKSLIEHKKLNEEIECVPMKKVLVVANVSAGKSTLINALVGYRMNVVRTTVCTNELVDLYCKCVDDGIMTLNRYNDYRYNDEIEYTNSSEFIKASFHFNNQLINKNFCFIDTPGFNNSGNDEHQKITEKFLKEGDYDTVIYVANSQYNGTEDDYRLLMKLKKWVHKPIIFVLNKLDQFKQSEDSIKHTIDNFKKDLQKIGFYNFQIIPVSAYAALLFKLDEKKLDEDDLFDKELYVKKFSKKYYDLPTYVGEKESSDLLEKTGIKNLEKLLIAK